jgi:parallel beta-helix repeat protein
MIKRILLTIFIIFLASVLHAQDKPLTSGMKISKSTRIRKGVYKIDAHVKSEEAVITIEGNNITIDFNNAELKGSNKTKRPDEFAGLAILIMNSKNVTIKNLVAKGYKVALRATNVEKLTLDNCDFSYNYRQHLNSTQEKEDLSDWMSYHHNEKDEWLRYGAAMYLRDCNFATIRNCKVTGGQNALMLMECNDGLIVNNDFSFNSGIGIGMYRSCRNKVMYNRIIFNVRGYSHGVYKRGQDSAGILVYEQSNENLFYKNNVTHGGDGFFLWAGQTTMDSGKGGCNDNVIMSNDFSYAPTNGVEVTFSRNTIVDNRIFECDHGIWGGYSFESNISSNKFRNNRIGIAIEHGQQNKVIYNVFYKEKEAIRLWGNKEEPSNWGYPKYRDTRSRDYSIVANTINKVPVALNISHTENLVVFNNSFLDCDRIFKSDSTVINLDTTLNDELALQLSMDTGMSVPSVIKPNDPFKSSVSLAGRKNIFITEWGPYDFRYPLIWNTNPVSKSDTMEFELLGPKGKWSLLSSEGGDFPYVKQGLFGPMKSMYDIDVLPKKFFFIKDTWPGSANDSSTENTELVLEFRGNSFTDQFGNSVPAGKPYKVKFQKFFQPINWEVMFYPLDTASHNPIKTGTLFSMFERKAPFKTEKVNKLDYAWWGGIKEAGVIYSQFITVASGSAVFPKGDYELSVTWDDAVRVYVDEKLVIDEWNPSLYTFDESPNKKVLLSLGGNQHFRVEHIELGGFATLSLKLKPVDQY